MERRVRLSLYIEDMFTTGHDAANRATVKQYAPEAMNVVGLALREDKKIVDKITKARGCMLDCGCQKFSRLMSCHSRASGESSNCLQRLAWMPACAGIDKVQVEPSFSPPRAGALPLVAAFEQPAQRLGRFSRPCCTRPGLELSRLPSRRAH